MPLAASMKHRSMDAKSRSTSPTLARAKAVAAMEAVELVEVVAMVAARVDMEVEVADTKEVAATEVAKAAVDTEDTVAEVIKDKEAHMAVEDTVVRPMANKVVAQLVVDMVNKATPVAKLAMEPVREVMGPREEVNIRLKAVNKVTAEEQLDMEATARAAKATAELPQVARAAMVAPDTKPGNAPSSTASRLCRLDLVSPSMFRHPHSLPT